MTVGSWPWLDRLPTSLLRRFDPHQPPSSTFAISRSVVGARGQKTADGVKPLGTAQWNVYLTFYCS